MVDFNCFLLVFSIHLRANNEEDHQLESNQEPWSSATPLNHLFTRRARLFSFFFFYWSWNHTIQLTVSLINHLQKHCDYSKASNKQQIVTCEDTSLVRGRAAFCDWFTLKLLQNGFNCNTTDWQYWEWCFCLSKTQLQCGGTISPSVKLHGAAPRYTTSAGGSRVGGFFLHLTVKTCCCQLSDSALKGLGAPAAGTGACTRTRTRLTA